MSGTKDLWVKGPAIAARWPIWGLIRQARHRSGLTQLKVAEITGLRVDELDDFENARSLPSIETLYAIVAACGLEMRIQLTAPDAQRAAMRQASQQRSTEDRISTNENAMRVTQEFRRTDGADDLDATRHNDG